MKLITLTGASASGKDFLLNKVLESNKDIKPIISFTTRPQREGEVDGVEYNFITLEQLTELYNNDKVVEYNTIHGVWYYGITKDSINTDGNDVYLAIVDVDGVVTLNQYLKSFQSDSVTMESIFVNCNGRERVLRSLLREPNLSDNQVAEVCRRYIDDEINIVSHKEMFNIILKNESLEDLKRCVLIINTLAQKGE